MPAGIQPVPDKNHARELSIDAESRNSKLVFFWFLALPEAYRFDAGDPQPKIHPACGDEDGGIRPSMQLSGLRACLVWCLDVFRVEGSGL